MWLVKTVYLGHEDPAEDGQESHESFDDVTKAEAQFCMRGAAVGVPPETAAAALVARMDQHGSASVSADNGAVSLTFQA